MPHRKHPHERFESFLRESDATRPGTSRYPYKLRAQVSQIASDLEQKPHERSPGAWATSLSTSATMLNFFSGRRDIEGQKGVDNLAQFLRISPDEVIENIRQLALKTKASAANYRQRGIDPQEEVTVNPKVAKAKKAILRWRRVEVPDGKSAEPEQSGGISR